MNPSFQLDQERIVLHHPDNDALIPIKGGISADRFNVIHIYKRGWITFAYLRDGKGVWWFNGRNNKATLVSEDVDSFRVLDDDYGLDSKQVYLEDKPIPESDPSSFELLPDSPFFARDKHGLYVKRGNHFHRFVEADPAALYTHQDYITDMDHLFHLYDSLRYANESKEEVREWFRDKYPDIPGWWHPEYVHSEEGAEPLAFGWYRTDNSIFYRTETDTAWRKGARAVYHLVRNAELESFEPLNEHFAKDGQHVYQGWRRIKGADPQTFQPLVELFARDSSHIFYNGYIVEGSDPDSFVPFAAAAHHGLAKDKRHVFHARHERTNEPYGHPDRILKPIQDADAASFELLSDGASWAADANRVYLWGEYAKHIDRESFRFLFDDSPQSWAMDHSGLYNANGKRTVKGINGGQFVMLNQYWGKDDQAVFCFVTAGVQKAADAASFHVTDQIGGAEDANFSYAIKDGAIKKTKKKR